MPTAIEIASSGRSKCRGCGGKIGKGELRLGERLANVFADGEMTLWFHVTCAAYRRPEAFLEAAADPERPSGQDAEGGAVDWAALGEVARVGAEHPRLQRIAGTQRSKTGRARCRHCKETIAKDSLRIELQYFEDARFVPSGFIHGPCALEYVGTSHARAAVARAPTQLETAELETLLANIE